MHDVSMFVTIRVLPLPSLTVSERFLVRELEDLPNCYVVSERLSCLCSTGLTTHPCVCISRREAVDCPGRSPVSLSLDVACGHCSDARLCHNSLQ